MRVEVKQEDITLEASLLKALAVKKNFEDFYSCLDTKRLIPITAKLLLDYKNWYKTYNTDIDFVTFYPVFCDWHKKDYDDQQLAYYRDTVFPLVLNSEIKNELFINLLEREAAKKIEQCLSGKVDDQSIISIIEDMNVKKSFYTLENAGMKTMTEISLKELDNTKGITWCLPALQAGLGSLMGGQFILLSADSNIGKSGLAITQVAHTLNLHLAKPVLYFDSEHTEKELRGRILSNLYKDKIFDGFEGVWKEEEKVYSHYKENYGENSLYTHQISCANDLTLIETYVKKYDPCLIVIDMIDIMSKSLSIQDLTPLYNRIRALANKGYPVIGTTQAGNTSYQDSETGQFKTRKWLTEKDTAGSKGGGKQGAAYTMIMIGKDDDAPDIRYLNVTKKKRGKQVSTTCEYIEKFSYYKQLL